MRSRTSTHLATSAVATLVVIVVSSLLPSEEALAVAKADDGFGTAESQTEAVLVKGTGITWRPSSFDLVLAYGHAGDCGVNCETFGCLGATSWTALGAPYKRKPTWGSTGWPGGTTGTKDPAAVSTTHASGSVSTSDWYLLFESISPPGTGKTGKISGSLEAKADCENLTNNSCAQTRTSWDDPLILDVPAGESATVTVERVLGPGTFARWAGDPYIEDGVASVDFYVAGGVSTYPDTVALEDMAILLWARVSTDPDSIEVFLHESIWAFDDGATALEKQQALEEACFETSEGDSVYRSWSVSPGEEINLGFSYYVDFDPYFSQEVRIGIGGLLSADEGERGPSAVKESSWGVIKGMYRP